MKINFNEEMKELTLSNGEILSYREHISTAEKHAITMAALEKSMIDGDYRYLIYKAVVMAQAIMYYTDVAIENIDEVNVLDIYDYFNETRLVNMLYDVCPDFAKFIELDSEKVFADARETINSAGYIIGKLGSEMIASIGTLMGSIAVANEMNENENNIIDTNTKVE